MAQEVRKKPKTKKTAMRVSKKPKRAPAKKTKANEPLKAIAANTRKPKEKSAPEVAATHIEHMAYGLGYRIPSAWWRHEGSSARFGPTPHLIVARGARWSRDSKRDFKVVGGKLVERTDDDPGEEEDYI